ncbi:MAG TPA: hypothetical protein VJM50_23750 [Pyrinomonadaceae bacterium]|nr:hypothetical protein [Pyrinomonadaceae bacterium]
MPTIEQTVIRVIEELGPGGVHAGLPAIQALEYAYQQFGDYSEWIVRGNNPPSNQSFDVVMQRYNPSLPDDVERKIVRDVRATYPHNSFAPIYYVGDYTAIEVDGWYVTHHAFPLDLPAPIPHSEP